MRTLLALLISLAPFGAFAQTGAPDDGLKYFVLQGVAKPEFVKKRET